MITFEIFVIEAYVIFKKKHVSHDFLFLPYYILVKEKSDLTYDAI